MLIRHVVLPHKLLSSCSIDEWKCVLRFRLTRSAKDAARDRPLNLLFQVIKRSKTRGDVKMTLRVGPTSLDRVDGERLQHRVSSLPLLSVEKVYLFTDDATQVRRHTE